MTAKQKERLETDPEIEAIVQENYIEAARKGFFVGVALAVFHAIGKHILMWLIAVKSINFDDKYKFVLESSDQAVEMVLYATVAPYVLRGSGKAIKWAVEVFNSGAEFYKQKQLNKMTK